jgi:GT2 family glycosyltransferase
VEREKFEAVGGFDETAFPVALNDVDLCLKLGARGLNNIYVPQARLLHNEGATRMRDVSRARRQEYENEVSALRERWSALIADDPCYSPWLTRMREDFGLE